MSIYSLTQNLKLTIRRWREKLGTLIAGKDVRPLLNVTAPHALQLLLEESDKKARPYLDARITTETKIEKVMFLEGARLYRNLLAGELKDVQSTAAFSNRSSSI